MKKGILTSTTAEKMPRREKYWKELSQKEKIERTREVVKRLTWQLEELKGDMRRINRHTHNEKGEAVVVEKMRGDYDQGSGEVRIREGKEDEVYF